MRHGHGGVVGSLDVDVLNLALHLLELLVCLPVFCSSKATVRAQVGATWHAQAYLNMHESKASTCDEQANE